MVPRGCKLERPAGRRELRGAWAGQGARLSSGEASASSCSRSWLVAGAECRREQRRQQSWPSGRGQPEGRCVGITSGEVRILSDDDLFKVVSGRVASKSSPVLR